MGMAQVYNVADVAAAVHQGIAQGEAQRMQGGFSMVSTFGGASSAPPPPAAPPAPPNPYLKAGARQIANTKKATNVKPSASSNSGSPGISPAEFAAMSAAAIKATSGAAGGGAA
jgi:hypothetical protein